MSLKSYAQNQATFYTTMGDFVVEMYNAPMPITTANFEKLVNDKFYDSIIFHRIIANFMMQGGDPSTRGGTTSAVIQDEFDAGTSNLKYTIAMANSGPNTGTSQFFINTKNNTFLDFDKAPATSKHPVFGKVISGFSVVDAIGVVATDGNDKPLTDVRMDSVRMTYLVPLDVENLSYETASITFYPNPVLTNSIININSTKELAAKLVVSNLEGKLLQHKDFFLEKGVNKFEIAELNIKMPGVYFIQVVGDNYASTKKVLVR